MEDHSYVLPDAGSTTCVHCRQQDAVPGYSVNLCGDCRAAFNRYPIPKWLYAFALGIAVLMIIGLVRMPGYLKAAVHLGRAKKAIAAHKYITAQRETDIVLRAFPHQLDANVYSFIAAAYNLDNDRLVKSNNEIEGKKVDDLNDDNSYEKLKDAQVFIKGLMPDDTLVVQRADSLSHTDTVSMNKYLDSLQGNDYAYAAITFASQLYENNNYKGCTAMAQRVLHELPNSYAAKALIVAAKRMTGDYDGSLKLCDELLKQNHEDPHVLAQKAKTEIKRGGHDDEAEQYIKQALALSPDDISALSTEALLYHYTGREAEGRKILADVTRLGNASGDTASAAWLGRVMNGQESYR